MKPKIIYLANASNIHTKRWAVHFSGKYSITILSFEAAQIANVEVITLHSPLPGLLRYLWVVPIIRNLLSEIRPNIVHAHYAGGYGLLGALSGFHPYVVSLWGSDVYQAPKVSVFHRHILKFILKKADYLCSTSVAMAREAKLYVNRNFIITPFGIDCNVYCPSNIKKPSEEIVIGTIKKLDALYGVDRLIKAFAILNKEFPEKTLRLLIVGDGEELSRLQSLSCSLGLSAQIEFKGGVSQEEVPGLLHKMSIYVALSRSESFGVAVLEASACGLPVVVSDAGGLPEVVTDGETGFIIPQGDPAKAAMALIRLVSDAGLRDRMSNAGREFVLSHYQWKDKAKVMENLYTKIEREF
ncbi:MAG: glycosyltransferase [Desulfuromonadaceae bacterium]|nr:glycosyltransferase [Desulfuromonadaceae bacterium]